MKSSFFNLSNSTSVTNLSIDYVGKYEVVYTFKNFCSLNAWNSEFQKLDFK